MRKLLLLLIALPAYAQVPISGTLDVDPATLRGPQGVQGPAGPAGRDATISYANGVCSSGGYSWPCSSSATPVPPPPPPAPVPPPPVPPPSGSYNLNAALAPVLALAPFSSFTTAAAPNITSQALVTTEAQFNASKNVRGRRTVVVSDITIDQIGWNTTDVELELRANLTCRGNGGGSHFGYRVVQRWRIIGAGGELRCPLRGDPSADGTLYGVTQRMASAGGTDCGNNLWGADRLNVLHSDIAASGCYGLFLHADSSRSPGGPADVLVVNSRIAAGGTSVSVHRVACIQRGVYLDSFFEVTGSGAAGFRQHDCGRNIYVDRNLWTGYGGRITPTAGVQNSHSISGVWILNTRIYERPFGNYSALQLSDPQFPRADAVLNVTATGNTISTSSGQFISGAMQPSWSVSNTAIRGLENPPAWARQPFAPLPADYRVLP